MVAFRHASVEVAAGSRWQAQTRVDLRKPTPWSPEKPRLYSLVQAVQVDGGEADIRRLEFGIRRIEIDSEHGLRINGRTYKMKGGAIHHDNYMLGAAGYPAADERKLRLLKSAGFNAIRIAHNPASQATLEAADHLGLMVIDEAFDAWRVPKLEMDDSRFFDADWYSDLTSFVESARNHPSVVMWSIGNEVREQASPDAVETARRLASRVRELDPTRPTTLASDEAGPKMDGLFSVVDVAGYNYHPEQYRIDHDRMPNRVIVGTESYPSQVSDVWSATSTSPWVLGDFVWTAFDYLGEASIGWTGMSPDWRSPGPFPWSLAYVGELDATGLRRPNSFYREVIWGPPRPKLFLFATWPGAQGSLPQRDFYGPAGHREWVHPDLHSNWTWPGQEGLPVEVVVYTTAEEVELRLNGRRIERQSVSAKAPGVVRFSVPYEPGTLEAFGFHGGQAVIRQRLQTADAPASLRLATEHHAMSANGYDLIYVTAQLTDGLGRPVYHPAFDREVQVKVSGAGVLAGVCGGALITAS